MLFGLFGNVLHKGSPTLVGHPVALVSGPGLNAGIPWSFSEPQILSDADRSLPGLVFFREGVTDVKQSQVKFYLTNWKPREDAVDSWDETQTFV